MNLMNEFESNYNMKLTIIVYQLILLLEILKN